MPLTFNKKNLLIKQSSISNLLAPQKTTKVLFLESQQLVNTSFISRIQLKLFKQTNKTPHYKVQTNSLLGFLTIQGVFIYTKVKFITFWYI